MTPGLETSHLRSKKNTKKRTPAGQLDLTCLLLGFLGIRSDWRDFFRWPFLLCGQLWGVFFFFFWGGVAWATQKIKIEELVPEFTRFWVSSDSLIDGKLDRSHTP